jgi:hypothetical protein
LILAQFYALTSVKLDPQIDFSYSRNRVLHKLLDLLQSRGSRTSFL